MTDMKEKRHKKPTSPETPEQENQASEPEKVENGPEGAQDNALDGMEVASVSEEPQEMLLIPRKTTKRSSRAWNNLARKPRNTLTAGSENGPIS